MDRPFDAADEALLTALLAGERDEAEPAVQARLRDVPALRERLARLRQFEVELDTAGAASRALLRNLLTERSPAEAATQALALRALRGEASPRPEPVTPHSHWRTVTLLAALVLVGLLLVTWWPRPASVDSTLGTLAIGTVEPAGGNSDYRLFRWNLPLPASGSYRLRFRDKVDGTIRREFELTETQWTPNPDEIRALPPQLIWEIDLLDAAGTPQPGGRGPFSLQYSPH